MKKKYFSKHEPIRLATSLVKALLRQKKKAIACLTIVLQKLILWFTRRSILCSDFMTIESFLYETWPGLKDEIKFAQEHFGPDERMDIVTPMSSSCPTQRLKQSRGLVIPYALKGKLV